jgi:radical SAM-linked protein
MRLRITFSKTEEMRYTGHLDLHRTWERTFRRAKLPIAYSQGYHPQPKISLAAALPLGFTSQAEVGDFWLEEDLALEEIEKALTKALPPGIKIEHMEVVQNQEPSLQSQVESAEYIVTLLDKCSHFEDDLAELLAAEILIRERRGKQYDLRPLIEKLEKIDCDSFDRPRLLMRLAARSGATGRPEEVLDALNIIAQAARIHRTQIYFAENETEKTGQS